MKDGNTELGKDYLTVLFQQIPILGSIIRDTRNIYSEKDLKQLILRIQSFVKNNKVTIERNLKVLVRNSEKLNKLIKINEDKFATIESKIDGILEIISSKNMDEKLSAQFKELKQMEKHLIEKHGKDYKIELGKKLTALFYELDHNIEWFNDIINAISKSSKSPSIDGKKEVVIAYKSRLVAMESFLSGNWLDDPKVLNLLSKVNDLTTSVETLYQRFLSTSDLEILNQLVIFSKNADNLSFRAIINLGFYWRKRFSGTYPDYRRECNKIYTCPKCNRKGEFFPSPGVIRIFCNRCQRPVPIDSKYCPYCNKKQPQYGAYLDVQYKTIETECKYCHSKILLQNEDFKLVFRDLS